MNVVPKVSYEERRSFQPRGSLLSVYRLQRIIKIREMSRGKFILEAHENKGDVGWRGAPGRMNFRNAL